jgi:hypothetical protein
VGLAKPLFYTDARVSRFLHPNLISSRAKYYTKYSLIVIVSYIFQQVHRKLIQYLLRYCMCYFDRRPNSKAIFIIVCRVKNILQISSATRSDSKYRMTHSNAFVLFMFPIMNQRILRVCQILGQYLISSRTILLLSLSAGTCLHNFITQSVPVR